MVCEISEYFLKTVTPNFNCIGTFVFEEEQQVRMGPMIDNIGFGYILKPNRDKVYLWGSPDLKKYDGVAISAVLDRRSRIDDFLVQGENKKRYNSIDVKFVK